MMPPRPRIRVPHDAAPVDDARRVWLSHWKTWATGRLPASASAATRSQVRNNVERALARHGVKDSENEVRDVVEGTLEPVLLELAEHEARLARERRKRENLEQVETWLELALKLRSGPRTTAMLTRPEYAKPVLVERLRRRLRRDLTGDEPSEEVGEDVLAFVDRCLTKQPPPPRRWARGLATGTLVTGLVTAQVLERNPELRVLAQQGLSVGRDRLRALLVRLTSVQKPPTS